mgnify:CR=1 FL=1
MTRSALIGHTGFVGSVLRSQLEFDATFNSKNIEAIAGRRFDRLVFAGAQSRKWWANAHPQEDWEGIRRALDALARVESAEAVLISTIDVVPPGAAPTEAADYDDRAAAQHAYGANRLALERAFKRLFPHGRVLRLPGLFGPGLKKNVLFDLLTGNLLAQINPHSRFQYYDLARLAGDLETTRAAGLELVHLVTEPLATAEIAQRHFPERVIGTSPAAAVDYDYRTLHAHHFGGENGYIEDRQAVLRRLDRFVAAWRAGAVGVRPSEAAG